LFVFCLLAFVFTVSKPAAINDLSLPRNKHLTKNSALPNILLFSADGVNADNLKLYGYQHQTTPNLDAFAKNALLIENTSTNSLKTFSSLLSILTSKDPATTKTFYPPHVLTGSSSYSHLPGILRQYGYKNVQISTEYYADAFQANLLNGFDSVNGRHEAGFFTASGLLKNLFSERIFINELFEKLKVRILHLLRIKKMRDHYREIVKNLKLDISDQARIDALKEFVKNTNQPFFAQIHLLATHCCRYRAADRVFTNDYDNAIYFTDKLFAEAIEVLKQENKLDNTIVVYSSDHTDHWGVIKRVPLIFIFPDSSKFETRKNNAQLLDIAPTLLDYLKIKKPAWMEGLSLLRSEPPENRPIFSFGKNSHTDLNSGPPYGISSYVVKLCQNWHEYDLIKNKLTSGITPNHSNHCIKSDFKKEKADALVLIKEHLYNRGLELGLN
jgi:arylsulfatase A-like enzyme